MTTPLPAAHGYDVVFEHPRPRSGNGRNLVPACTCGWRGTPVDPTTLGTKDTIRKALHAPWRQHRDQAIGAAA